MTEHREVYGVEAQVARGCAKDSPTIVVRHGGFTTWFFFVPEEVPATLLRKGYYEVSGSGGIVIHYTNKSAVLAEIGALTRTD